MIYKLPLSFCKSTGLDWRIAPKSWTKLLLRLALFRKIDLTILKVCVSCGNYFFPRHKNGKRYHSMCLDFKIMWRFDAISFLYAYTKKKSPVPVEKCYLWHLSNEKQIVHCEFYNDCHELIFSLIVFIVNDLTKLINKKTRKKIGRKSRCFMSVRTGKSLLESGGTTFLPDWQPPLIFVWFTYFKITWALAIP